MNRLAIAGGNLHGRLIRLTKGRFLAKMGKAPVLLLTTRGRTTGKERVTPLLYVRDGDALVVVASAGGSPENPSWFLNLQAGPDVTVELDGVAEPRRARIASDEEKARFWPQLLAIWPTYDKYRTKTDRDFPVVVLERR